MLRVNSIASKTLTGKKNLIESLITQSARYASTGSKLEADWKKIAQKQLKEKPVESLTFKTAEVNPSPNEYLKNKHLQICN
jgi:hypothetical protein